MRILLSGGTGFIGKQLCVELLKRGHELTLITRNKSRVARSWQLPTTFVEWDMQRNPSPPELDPREFDALIHLAGESIAGGLWTKARRQVLLDSRVKTSRALGAWLKQWGARVPCLISASAIGYYSDKGDAILDEGSPAGNGFLSDVCQRWEEAVQGIPAEREVRLRFGLVLGEGGGLLSQLRLTTDLGMGAVIGNGRQMMSWVHRDDLLAIVCEALERRDYEGPINVVAPSAICQREFQRTLSKLMHRPRLAWIPAFLPRLALGEMARLVLGSQHVLPKRLSELSYRFRYPTIEAALGEALDLRPLCRGLYPCHRLEAVQFIPHPRDKVVPFFASAENLEALTPPQLSFRILRKSSDPISEGTRIDYRIRLRGLPMRWRTRICEWRMPERFADDQEKGPYAIWYHTHAFFPMAGGTLMVDRVRYRLPLGFLGDKLGFRLVEKEVEGIFAYRREAIDKEFPAMYHESHVSH